jgi:hypothetical protein
MPASRSRSSPTPSTASRSTRCSARSIGRQATPRITTWSSSPTTPWTYTCRTGGRRFSGARQSRS